MKVKEHMTANPVVIEKDSLVSDAKNIFDENRFRHLPVVDGGGKIVGILSDRDVTRSIAISDSVMSLCGMETGGELKVGEIMSENLLSVGPEDTLKEAARIMMEKKIGCLPVLNDGHLAGIITETDILRVFMDIAG